MTFSVRLLSVQSTLLSTSASASQNPWWLVPVLSGVFALFGVLIAQGVVLYLANRNEKRRSEPELIRQCAIFSSACGRLKNELQLKEPSIRNFACIDDLETSHEALTIIAPNEIDAAAEGIISVIPVIFHAEKFGDTANREKYMSQLFLAHRIFIDTVRTAESICTCAYDTTSRSATT
jgi:hypothetical protein